MPNGVNRPFSHPYTRVHWPHPRSLRTKQQLIGLPHPLLTLDNRFYQELDFNMPISNGEAMSDLTTEDDEKALASNVEKLRHRMAAREAEIKRALMTWLEPRES